MGFETNLHNLNQFFGAAIIREVTKHEEKSSPHTSKGFFSAISDFFTALWPSAETRDNNKQTINSIKESIQKTYGDIAATNFGNKFSETSTSLLTVSARRSHIKKEIGPEAIIKERAGETNYDSVVAADLYENMFRLDNGKFRSNSGTGREQKSYKAKRAEYFKLRQELFNFKKTEPAIFNAFMKEKMFIEHETTKCNQGLGVNETNLPKYHVKSHRDLTTFSDSYKNIGPYPNIDITEIVKDDTAAVTEVLTWQGLIHDV